MALYKFRIIIIIIIITSSSLIVRGAYLSTAAGDRAFLSEPTRLVSQIVPSPHPCIACAETLVILHYSRFLLLIYDLINRAHPVDF